MQMLTDAFWVVWSHAGSETQFLTGINTLILGVKKNLLLVLIVNNFLLPLRMAFKLW